MGSGEQDGYYITKIAGSNTSSVSNNLSWGDITTWSYPHAVYYYQIRCGKRSCKTLNWLEIDKVKACTNCGAKLKAVLDEPDYTIPVEL